MALDPHDYEVWREAHEQWLVETAGPERDEWLSHARHNWEQKQLPVYEKHLRHVVPLEYRYTSLQCSKDDLRLFAVDLSVLDSLQDALIKLSTHGPEDDRHRDWDMILPSNVVWQADIPPAVAQGIGRALAKMVHAAPSLTRLESFETPLATVVPLLAVYKDLISIFFDMPLGTHGRTTEQLRDMATGIVAHHTTLEDLNLFGLDTQSFRILSPAIAKLSHLKLLTLNGNSSRLVLSTEDAKYLGQALRMTQLVHVRITRISFVSSDAADALCAALRNVTMSVLSLTFGEVPEKIQQKIVWALANSPIRELHTTSIVTEDTMTLFCETMVASKTSQLERLLIRSDRRHFEDIFQPKSRYHVLQDWAWPVRRALDLHSERRITKPIMEALEADYVAPERLLYSHVFSLRVHPAIHRRVRIRHWPFY